MSIIESISVAMSSIISNKLRSFLTMLGIIIGISSVITIVSLGQGGQSAITGEFQKIGVNVLQVTVDSSTNVSKGDYFTKEDVKQIKDKIKEVKNAAPYAQGQGVIRTEKSQRRAFYIGTNSDYTAVNSLDILYGRFINEKDVLSGKNVVLIDDISAKRIFGYEDAVGKTIKVGSRMAPVNAVIIGIFKNPNGSFPMAFTDNMPTIGYIPITFLEKISNNFNMGQIEVLISDSKNSESAASNINRLLESRHHNSGKYKVENMMKQLEQVNNILNIFTTIIGAIAGISLLVGGIGVMNIMLVSVTERTREIGIRKAIGAKRRDILVQFLIESLIISLIGGIIGMVLGITAAKGVGSFLNVKPSISLSIVAIAFGFSSAVGIFFGIYPANKASKLDPIEALRYE